MILAAGFGTRMQPITLTRPKALVEVAGVTLLERNIRYLISFGVEEIVINVHHFAEQIVAFLKQKNDFNIKISISDETDAVLETGGGLQRAKTFLQGKEDFILMNVDILTNLNIFQLIDYHVLKSDSLATLAVTTRPSSRQLLFDEKMQLQAWENSNTGEKIWVEEEKIGLKSMSFSGVHIISPTIFDELQMQGKFSIITAYLALAKSHKIYGYCHDGDLLLDVGKPDAIEIAAKMFDYF